MQINSHVERRAVASVASLYITRMLGLFMVLPVLVVLGSDYQGASPVLLGLALGIYGLTQALLQIPLGLLSDYIGRKPVIIAGLVVFAVGSVVAALAQSVEWLICGRALQGGGAIAAALMALLTDLTSEQNRTRAMASVGASIGVAFALSLVLGPLISASWGLSGIFWFTAALALIGIAVAVFIVPQQPASHGGQVSDHPWARLGQVLSHPQLVRLDLGVFFLHLLLTALFVVLPGQLVQALDLPVSRHWQIYLPVMVLSFIAMVPFIIAAEKRGKTKPVFLFAVACLVVSLLCLSLGTGSLPVMMLLLLVFFWGFNLLEATLPSLMSKLAPPATKGAASGVYSTCQFLGAFSGGILGGWLYQGSSAQVVFLAAAVIALIWLLVSASMSVPRPTQQVLVQLENREFDQLVGQLQGLEGVVEVTYLEQQGAAALRVHSDRFQRASLQALGLQ